MKIDITGLKNIIKNKLKHFSELSIEQYNKFGNGEETKYCDEQVVFWERFELELEDFINHNKEGEKE